jgi:AP2 domain.
VKKIELANGRGVALVDDEDYDWLNQHRWSFQIRVPGRPSSGGYAMRWAGGRNLTMHRELMDSPPGLEVDHRNGDGLDNQRANLRVATRSLNGFNKQHARADSSSGVLGVCPFRRTGKWHAQIMKDRRRVHLGYFDDLYRAVLARRDAELKYFGEVTPATQTWLAENAA